MYVPKHFSVDHLPAIQQFMRDHAFATLVNCDEGAPVATHIPLELQVKDDSSSTLVGHISRANPQWKTIATNNKAMAIFTGPHAYVSSSWYNHENVPTWNYIAIHVSGSLRIIEGEELKQRMGELMAKYEAGVENPQSFYDMSEEKIARKLRGIVGLELQVEKVEANYKLSQNRNDEDYQNIIKELEQLNDYNAAEIAKEMAKLR